MPTTAEVLGSDPSAKHTHKGILGQTPQGPVCSSPFSQWLAISARAISNRSQEASLGIPVASRVFQESPSRPPGKFFLPDRLFPVCNPSSHFRTVPAPGLASAEGRHCSGPNGGSRGCSFQVGRGGGPSGPRSFSQYTAVASRRSSGHRRANRKGAGRENREKYSSCPEPWQQGPGQAEGQRARDLGTAETQSLDEI